MGIKLSATERKYDLEERLINFASKCIDVAESLPSTFAGNHIGGQLIRSGTSPALHYGEAQAAESINDFIHKMKVCLKELRETYNSLRLIKKKDWYPAEKLDPIIFRKPRANIHFCNKYKDCTKKRNESFNSSFLVRYSSVRYSIFPLFLPSILPRLRRKESMASIES